MLTLAHLFSKTRAEVLRLLFDQPGKESHLRNLARDAGLSPSSLLRELTSLVEMELVISQRDGNRHYYRANEQHPLYPELRGLVQKTSGMTAEIQRALINVEGVDAVLIFGSTAADAMSSSSDIDLLVLGAAGLRKVTSALRGLGLRFNRELNPVCFTIKEWAEKLSRGDIFAKKVWTEPKLWLKGNADVIGELEGQRVASGARHLETTNQ